MVSHSPNFIFFSNIPFMNFTYEGNYSNASMKEMFMESFYEISRNFKNFLSNFYLCAFKEKEEVGCGYYLLSL